MQGEREMAADNKMLGQFDLVGIPPAPRGVPQIEVTFDIDANGIVNVSAKDKATGKEQNIAIQSSGGLSDDEIEKMVQDAEANAAADEERRAAIDAKNDADSLVHNTEKTFDEHKEKLSAEDQTEVEEALKECKAILEDDDATVETIKEKSDALQQAAMKIGQAMYGQGDGAEGSDDNKENDPKDDAEEATFEEEKKKD